MSTSNNNVEEIKNRLDIVQVIEKYVKLKKAGKNYSGNCPFHQEKTPSFMVSPDIQRYKCFGCGESGDIFNFVQKIENLDFPETLEKLAEQAGITIERKEYNPKYKELEEINYKATKYYYNKLLANKDALEYITQRGFSKDSIKTFGVGYAPKQQELEEELKGYTKKTLLESGLFTQKNGSTYPKFRERIMFPIRSSRGKVIGFTGRSLPGNDWGPKYLNTPETILFKKKDNVYGQYESKQEIRKEDLTILCEGSTDVISAHQHGIKNIVAPLGTGLTTEQMQKLSMLTKNFLFFFDNDDAGVKALIRGFKIASQLELNPYATSATPYKDIDELLQKDPKRIKYLIKNKTEAFTYLVSEYIKDKNVNKLEDLSKTKTFVKDLLEAVKDPSTKELYIRKTNKILKTDLFETNKTQNKTNANNTVKKTKEFKNKPEEVYLKLLLLKDSFDKKNILPSEYIKTNSFRKIYDIIVGEKWKTKEELYSLLQEDTSTKEVFEDLIFNLTDLPTTEPEIKKELEQLEKLIEKQHLRSKQKDLTVKIAIAEENNRPKESEKYLKELIEINKLLQKITNG